MSDDKQKEIFVINLNRYLKNSGKTQKEVADAIGVSPQTFNTWMVGIALPRIGKVQKLADYFGIKKSDLIEKKEDNHLDNISSSLLSKFNQLTPANKTTVMGMIDLLLSQQSSESKKTATCV